MESGDRRLLGLTPDKDGIVDEVLPGLGGWGKAAILIVLRRFFSGLAADRPLDTDLSAAIFVVECDRGDLGSCNRGLEGDCNLVLDRDEAFDKSDKGGENVLAFVWGRGGKAPEGGFVAGRDGCGRADIDAISVLSSALT